MISTLRRTAVALATTSALVATTACGSEPDDAAAPTLSDTEHNDADVAFASDMIPHHAQALAMVDLTRDRDLSARTATLVEGIREAQAPEIETMVDWLVDWGEDVPATMRDHVNAGHGDHGEHGDAADSMEHTDADMPGMMSAEEMNALADASDAEFEDLWLTMMVEHHEGAVEMARTETEEGRYRPAVQLAEQIIDAQESEIAAMEKMLAG